MRYYSESKHAFDKFKLQITLSEATEGKIPLMRNNTIWHPVLPLDSQLRPMEK